MPNDKYDWMFLLVLIGLMVFALSGCSTIIHAAKDGVIR